MSTQLDPDPYNYADIDVYTFNVNFDLTRGGLDVEPPVKTPPAPLTAAYPFVVCTPDGIYGPYATRSEAQSLIEDEVVDPTVSEVVQLSTPEPHG